MLEHLSDTAILPSKKTSEIYTINSSVSVLWFLSLPIPDSIGFLKCFPIDRWNIFVFILMFLINTTVSCLLAICFLLWIIFCKFCEIVLFLFFIALKILYLCILNISSLPYIL